MALNTFSEKTHLSGVMPPSTKHPFEEIGLHKQFCKSTEEIKISKSIKETDEKLVSKENTNLTMNNDAEQFMTPKSQKQNSSDVKRWASVVKAQKKIQFSSEKTASYNQLEDTTQISPELFDSIFKTFPKSFENHKSFITVRNNLFSCSVCCIELDSVLSISNHLKTRKHEDTVITFLKEKLPPHLHHVMEFVSFYGSYLCCNLCRCKIAMASQSPHETLVNIMAHNSDAAHASQKAYQTTYNQGHNLLKKLAKIKPEIKNSVHLFDPKINIHFKCNLCNKNVIFDENFEILANNFLTHLKSVGHVKNHKAVETLKLFEEISLSGKASFVALNGNLTCTFCKHQVETDLQKLVSHEKGVDHVRNMASKMEITTSLMTFSEEKLTRRENQINEAKFFSNQSEFEKSDVKEKCLKSIMRKVSPDSRLNDLLKTMPLELKNTDCIIENDRGSVTCLVCNRVVPPSTYNLRTHLLGSNHKKNVEMKKGFKSKEQTLLSKKNENVEKTVDSNCILDTAMEVSELMRLLPAEFKNLSYIVKNNKGLITCQLCKCSLTPDPEYIQKHLMGIEHKKNESLWLKGCGVCSGKNLQVFEGLNKVPKQLRTFKCNRAEKIPPTVLTHLYRLLVNENHLVSKNESVLVKNVDGKHTYCKLCKSLIPVSLDLTVLENNVVMHLKSKRHLAWSAELNKASCDNQINECLNEGKVSRSLFNLPTVKDIIVDSTRNIDFKLLPFHEGLNTSPDPDKTTEQKSTNIPEGRQTPNQTKETELLPEAQLVVLDKDTTTESSDTSPKAFEAGVFVFGKENNIQKDREEETQIKPSFDLPVGKKSYLTAFEIVEDEEVLSRRQKQIDYGKNTDGYTRYCQVVTRRRRANHHPVTPPKHLKCSRRTWDGMVRAWRRQLHHWDPQGPGALDNDIKPLQ